MIRKILLDLDGVCTRLIMHALEANGCDVSRYFDSDYPLPGNYAIIEAAGLLLGRKVTASEFWRRVPRTIWATTPPTDEFIGLVARAEAAVGRENVCFLTSPTIDADSAAGKVEWIQRYAPRWLHRQYLIGPRKHFCAHPETLLVDDSDAVVKEFREHGGHAIHVPRPWNSRHAEDPRIIFAELASYSYSVTAKSPASINQAVADMAIAV